MKKEMQYTHMGWNSTSVELLPFGWGDEFPAFITHKAALDNVIIDMMRPMMNKGYRVDAISDLLLELHSKTYYRWSLRYEYDLMRARANPMKRKKTFVTDETFSSFDDPDKYNDQVPTGSYLGEARKRHHSTISLHLDREVKKRPVERLTWDVSYKEGKNLCQYKGQYVFKGLVTGINEFGEVRISFHILTDSQDQFNAALEAFLHTVDQYGHPRPQFFSTDNPTGDYTYFTGKIASLRSQQEVLNALSEAPVSNSDEEFNGMQQYPFNNGCVDVASGATEIDAHMAVMADTMGDARVVGFDTETKVVTNNCRRPTGGKSRVGLMQFAYWNNEGKKRVLLVRICKHRKLRPSIIAFFRDHSITLAGNNIKGDLTTLGKDYPEIGDVLKSRGEKNIINLGVFARRRDVVQSGAVGLPLLVKRLLNLHLPKNDEDKFSDWNKDELDPSQIAYASKDALAHLDVYEKLLEMPDLNLRLREGDIVIGSKVDIVPRFGYYRNVSGMATRAATGVILDLCQVQSPIGIEPKLFNRGKTSVAVEIETIYSPSFLIPKYSVRSTDNDATLGDIGKATIVVPLSMLREHSNSPNIRSAPPPPTPAPPTVGITQPATAAPTIGAIATNTLSMATQQSSDVADDFFEAESIENLSSADIEMIRASSIHAERAQNGKLPLRHPKLNDPPRPSAIRNVYSSVLGDPFHAISRPKIPTHHEHKKGYKVALQNAFFIWNPTKLNDLENRMKDDGMTEEQIEHERYYNSGLYRSCVDRFIPPPKLLYWRVRAVFFMYGQLIDGKSDKPLFNNEAWSKADNLLKEILKGFYSDPPGVQMYTKRLNPDGSVRRNKFGMEEIECSRGTNRVEAYHKNLAVTFGGWHMGVGMSNVLLAENRHRHNQRCSERRRDGFPMIGHYDTWLVDLRQRLVQKNHNITLYPSWTNASEFKDTDESFDTVALHSSDLHTALENCCNRIQIDKIKLSLEQKSISRAQGVRLPFLPFSRVEEKALYTRHYSVICKKTEEEAAIWWCNHVNDVTIFPKLPVNFRMHLKKWLEGKRAAKKGAEKLAELNCALSPSNISAAPTVPAAAALVATETNRVIFQSVIPRPAAIPQPNEQALHNKHMCLSVVQ